MQVVGIHSLGHDTGLCLWEDGELIYSIETERLTRRRHETDVDAAIEALKRHPRFDLAQLKCIASSTYFRQNLLNIPDPKAVNIALTVDKRPHLETNCSFLGKKLPCIIVAHEASHATIGLHTAGYANNTTILVNEGRGIFSRNALYHYTDGKIQLIDHDLLPWFASGFGWSALGYLIGLGRTPSAAGKAMALSAFQPVFDRELSALREVPQNLPNLPSNKRENIGRYLLAKLEVGESFDARCRLVSALQSLFTQTIHEILGKCIKRLGTEHLALSGGCALNIITNSKLREAFKQPIFIPAACNDAGQALGAALYTLKFCMGITPHPFSIYSTGDPITPQSARTFLMNKGLNFVSAEPSKVAELLANGKVIALAHGKSEIGPRALGNRSLLADPAIPGIKKRVSEKLKGRESFRPLAPIMRRENFEQLLPGQPLSPKMLFNYNVKGLGFGDSAHVDDTARIQTITRDDNPFVHEILTEFESYSSSPALINTSLNSGGRPICLTEADVLADFDSTQVDAYVLSDYLVINA